MPWIIQVLIVLAIVGFLLWLVETVIPMDATIKTVFRAVVIFAVVLWLLTIFFGFATVPLQWGRH